MNGELVAVELESQAQAETDGVVPIPGPSAAVWVRRMSSEDLEDAVEVWRAAKTARGAPPDASRSARVREKLLASDASAMVALDPQVVGMALAEPGRRGDGQLNPELLHISMVFVHPAAQGRGVGRSLLLRLLDEATAHGYRRASVWTCLDNAPARRLYASVGMAATGDALAGRTQYRIRLI
jgi:ribosomal protein S18 acetylase RimI-like enzyme